MPQPQKHWKVKLHVVDPAAPRGKPEHVENFGVSAPNHDGARAAARKWLTDHSYKIRALSFTRATLEMVAYASKETKK